ncbi:hypothetical protein QFC21_000460 [Naganishia friedmannii]|uniref:Uncharacterized protein n=1 Tax=Naganishia friedmannii TaxID=89922 RepID=A0ACC2WBV7_9TREE|nr:hypothetical protein QFC21_000460 [Naganishia friedmannii]
MSKFSELPGFNTEGDSSSGSSHVGKRVLITGGASGIGRQVAMRYVHQGECFTPNELCDVTSKASTTSLFAFSQTVFNGHPPDIVIANAGVNEVGHLEDDIVLHNKYGAYPEKPGQVTLDVNLSGAILTAEVARWVWKDASQAHASEMGRQRKLVLISSMGGWEGIPMGTLYSMAKHGILGYWVALAAEQERLKDNTFSYFLMVSLQAHNQKPDPFRPPNRCHAICPFFAATAILDTAVKHSQRTTPAHIIRLTHFANWLSIPQQILLALAGIPKTTPEDVALAIEVVGRDTPTGAQRQAVSSRLRQRKSRISNASLYARRSVHTAVLLPDDKTPLVIGASDFDPLSQEMYADLSSVVNQRQPQPGDPEYTSTTWTDIKQALAHNKQASSAKPLLGAAMAAIAVNTLARQLSVFQNLAFGFLAAAAIVYFTPKATMRGEAVKA